MTIGITDCGTFSNYTQWILAANPETEIVKLSAELKNQDAVGRCFGILLSGGGDVHPRFYGRESEYPNLDPKNIDERRDEFEFEVVRRALDEEKPLLGVCRGLQLVNVYLGGTLVIDLEKAGYTNHRAVDKTSDRIHNVTVNTATNLFCITGCKQGAVNSSHHQAIDSLGKGLRVSAIADDGAVEAIEGNGEHGSFFFTMVQWHPERLKESRGFSMNLVETFLHSVSEFEKQSTIQIK